jgi:hypothetical protein
VQYADRETIAPSELQTLLLNVTSKPQKQTYYATYNSGYLEYQFKPNTVSVEIPLKFTVDEIPYYGNKGVLQDAIKITSLIDGVIQNQVMMDVKQG